MFLELEHVAMLSNSGHDVTAWSKSFEEVNVLSTTRRQENVKIVVLSGPTHAEVVAQDLPTTIVPA